MAQPINPWLQFIGPKGQTAQNQWLQKLNDLYNNPQLRFAVDRAGDLIDKTQSDEEESDVEKLGQIGNNVLDTVRQLQQTSSTVPQTAAQFNTMGAKEAFDIINNARQTGANSVNTVKNLAQSSQQTFKNIGQTIKQINNVGPRSSIPQIGKPINSAVKTAGKAGAKGAQAASNAASIAGGAAGLALTAGSHLFDIGMSTRSKFRDKVATYEPVNSYDDLNNFNIHYADRKLSRPSFGSMAADVALKTTEGALAGAMLANPWTTAGGAVGGFFAGIGNSIAKVGTYKADQRRALNSDNLAYNSGLQYFHNAGNQLNDMTNTNTLYNLKQSRGQKMAEGGQIENVFNNGGTHESNPYGGIFQGQDQVEEGEVRIGDFIFSARVNADRDILSKFNCAVKRENATYADIAKQILDNFNERNDYISNKTKRILFERLAQAQEYQKVSEEAAKYGMTPEEYTQYQQQLQEQQAAQEQYQQEEAPVDEQQMMMQQPFYEDVEPQQYPDGGSLGKRSIPYMPFDLPSSSSNTQETSKWWIENYFPFTKFTVNEQQSFNNENVITDRPNVGIGDVNFTNIKQPIELNSNKLGIKLERNNKSDNKSNNESKTSKFNSSTTKGKSKYEYIDYTDSYKQNRDNDDILSEFLKYYNDNNKTKYDLDTIRKNLSDNKLGPITKSFMDWLNNRYQYDPEWTPEPLNTADNPDLQNTTPIENLTRPTINDVLNDSNKEESEEPNDDWKAGLYDAARMIPTLGKLRGILEQEEPDEAYANEILSYYRPTDYNPTGRYKTYSPADQYMLMRQARAQRNALAQQYLANAGGNPAMANYMLAVNDAQYNQDLADNYLKVKQYNDQLKDQALEYNNQLDEANEVRRANIQQTNNQLWANLGLPAAAAREQERRDVEEAKYANQESFWNDLAAIARERQDRELIRRNPALMYDAWINYKNKKG